MVARQAEAALVIAHDLRSGQRSQFVALEGLEVPVAVGRTDVVAQAPDPDDTPNPALTQLDELIGAHRREASARTAALNDEWAVTDVFDARGEDEQRMVIEWTAPTEGDRQRWSLVEVRQEEVGQTTGRASGAGARSQEHHDDPKPKPHWHCFP